MTAVATGDCGGDRGGDCGGDCGGNCGTHTHTHQRPCTRTHTNTRAHAHTSHDGTGRSAGATPRHTRRGRPAPTAAAVNGPRQERGDRACPRQLPRPVPQPHSTHPPTAHLRRGAGVRASRSGKRDEVGGVRRKRVCVWGKYSRSASGSGPQGAYRTSMGGSSALRSACRKPGPEL